MTNTAQQAQQHAAGEPVTDYPRAIKHGEVYTGHFTPYRVTDYPRAIKHDEIYMEDFTPYPYGKGWHGKRGTADCGHSYTNVNADGSVSGATGYAIDLGTDKSLCYSCVDSRERALVESAERGGVCYAYLSGDAKHVTTWTGGELMRVTSASNSRSGFHGSEIWHIGAVDNLGRYWYGRNAGPGMCIKLHLSKRTAQH